MKDNLAGNEKEDEHLIVKETLTLTATLPVAMMPGMSPERGPPQPLFRYGKH